MSPTNSEPFVRLMKGDCLERMAEIEDGSIDMILCDLPYGTTQNAWDAVIPFAPLWAHYERLCGRAIVLTGVMPFSAVLVMSRVALFRYSWVWLKEPSGNLNAKRQPMNEHEDVLVFGREVPYFPQGLRPTRRVRGVSDISRTGNYGSQKREGYVQTSTGYPGSAIPIAKAKDEKVHPTQKPVALLDYLIRTYTTEGQTVLDNTMGSGSTGVAAVRRRRSFVGIEKDPEHYQTAKARIAWALDARP